MDSYLAFDQSFRGGIFVAAGDLDGDFRADVVVGAGNAGGPHVRAFRGLDHALLTQFMVHETFAPSSLGQIPLETGVRVSLADLDGDGRLDIVTGKGRGTRPIVRAFRVAGGLAQIADTPVFDAGFGGGIYIG